MGRMGIVVTSLISAGLIVAGVFMVSIPAGLICAGVLVAAVGALLFVEV